MQTLAPDQPSPGLDEALAELAAFSLAKHNATSTAFTVHRLVQEVMRGRITETERPDWIRRSLELVNGYAVGNPNDVRTWPRWDPLRPHASAIVDHAEQAGIMQLTTRLMNELGQLLDAKSLYHEAEPLMRRALAIDERSFGPDHPNVARDLNNLASLLWATNRLAEAEPLMRRALAIDERPFGPDHPDVARDLNNLAKLLKATNRLAEAEPLLRRVVIIFRDFARNTGHQHPHMKTIIGNYASLLEATGLSEAEIEQRIRSLLQA